MLNQNETEGRMSQLAAALIAQLDDDALAELAARLAPFLPQPETADGDRWLNTRQAAEYLGISPNALHKLTAARTIPFQQDRPGAKCWFRQSELDGWRQGGLTTMRT
jgi:excisionase family DNA binding protein